MNGGRIAFDGLATGHKSGGQKICRGDKMDGGWHWKKMNQAICFGQRAAFGDVILCHVDAYAALLNDYMKQNENGWDGIGVWE